MILTDQEAEDRLGSSGNLFTSLLEVRKLKEATRGLGNVNVPPALRSLIGSIAVQGDENHSDIAEAFGISQPSVTNYSKGLVGNRRDEELSEAISDAKENVAIEEKKTIDQAHQAALDVMVASITKIGEKLTGEEGATLKAKELSRIAADMSKIVSVATGQDKGNVVNNTKVIVYAPQQKQETQYDVIEV